MCFVKLLQIDRAHSGSQAARFSGVGIMDGGQWSLSAWSSRGASNQSQQAAASRISGAVSAVVKFGGLAIRVFLLLV